MKKTPDTTDAPVLGIVITCGKQVHVEPKLSSYVWSDEGADADSSTKAA